MYVSEKIIGGKLLGVELETKNNKISKLQITGDFFLHPEDTISLLENSLLGIKKNIKTYDLDSKISNILKNSYLVGASSSDIGRLIKKAINLEVKK